MYLFICRFITINYSLILSGTPVITFVSSFSPVLFINTEKKGKDNRSTGIVLAGGSSILIHLTMTNLRCVSVVEEHLPDVSGIPSDIISHDVF